MLILDTSVMLNLVGTGNPRLILRHIPTPAYLPKAVLNEIQRETQVPRGSSLANLIEDGCISQIECTPEMHELALELAGAAAPDHLGDGESYAIACAVHSGAIIGIDDQKGRRISRARWPKLTQHFSVDLILEAATHAKLRPEELADLIYQALKNTRMRVPKDRRAEIVKLLGQDRARECPSLGMIP